MELELNAGQAAAVEGVLVDIENGEPGASIVGEGGTGKTFSTAWLLHILMQRGKRVLMAAPTNKAVKQLEKAARKAGLNTERITFSTIHTALGLALMPSSERKHVSRAGEPILPRFDIVVLDEGSMVNSILLDNYILPDLEQIRLTSHPVFLLGMGDLFQLPPVKEARSKMFDLFKVYELTENQRQLDNEDGTPNGILQLCRALRQAIAKEGPFYFCKQPVRENPRATVMPAFPDFNVFGVLDKDFLPLVLSKFDLSTDLEDVRVIAWRNTRIDFLNAQIRKKLYGPNAAPYEIDEQVVTGGPVKNDEGFTILGTDEECRVAAVTESVVYDERDNSEWRTLCLVLHPIYADINQVFVHVVHPDERERYQAKVDRLAEDARNADNASRFRKWARFHEFQDLFNDIRYCYAITAHRAQGSTYRITIVDVKDMMDNPKREEAQRLIYVGLSRPTHELYFNKMQFMV